MISTFDMSVVGEIVGIIACVAGVVSAYHDGGAIIQKIKVKRAAKQAPPPPRLLEESIDQAPEEIEREKKRGVARFGRAFEEGDHIAVIALQQITIQLQGSLLEKLRHAAFDDEATDFTNLVDAADIGRDRTIGTLLELRQRLLQAAPIAEVATPQLELSMASQTAVRMKELSAPTKDLPVRAREHSAPAPPRPYRIWTREYSNSREASGEEDAGSGPDDNDQHQQRKRHSSLLGILIRHHRSHSGSHESAPKTVEQACPLSSSPASIPIQLPKRCDASEPPTEVQRRQEGPSFIYEEWEDDPGKIWGKLPDEQRRDTVASIAVPPDGGPVSPVGSALAMTRSTSNNAPSFSHSTYNGSTAIPTPTPENEYLSFCKSAVRLQNGDRKAMTKCKEFNDGWSQSSVYFLGCASSKCAFAGHIALDKIWDKVWPDEAKGLKFRWSFLAKSHVSQQKVKDHQYIYQCVFCVFLGEKSPVFAGTDTYLAHVQEHRGHMMNEVILYKTKCIADRIAEDEEEYDINLWPLSTKEQVDRRKSNVLADELMGPIGPWKRINDAQDSMFSANEPWNEGLSDFHWSGDMERSELE